MLQIRASGTTIASKLFICLLLGMSGCTQSGHEDAESSVWTIPHKIYAWINHHVWRTEQNYDIESIFEKQNIVPLAVIGSGPAGLAAGIYGARDNVFTLIIKGPEAGGLLMKTTHVENWPGEILIMGPEIITKLNEQATHDGVHFVSDTITNVDFSQWPFVLNTAEGETIHALAVVIATGASPKKLEVPGEQEYWGLGGSGVSGCAICDARFTKGKQVVVVGGGDSAIEQAMQLANHADTVTILVRKDQMRAASSGQERLAEQPNIKVLYNVEIKKIIGTKEIIEKPGRDGDGTPGTWVAEDAHVTGIELYNNQTKETTHMPIDAVFLAVGHTPNSQVFAGKIDMDPQGYIKMKGRTQRTSVTGVFAAGEVEDHRYRQAGSSFGDGSKGTLDAMMFLRDIGYSKGIQQRLQDAGILWQPKQAYELPEIDTLVELRQAFSESDLVVLDFWAPDCPSCLHMLPTVGSVAKELEGKAAFYKVNASGEMNEVSELVTQYHISKIPTLLVFKDGQQVAVFAGVKEKQDLLQGLSQFITSR